MTLTLLKRQEHIKKGKKTIWKLYSPIEYTLPVRNNKFTAGLDIFVGDDLEIQFNLLSH